MRAFQIAAGTKVKAIGAKQEWLPANFHDCTTTRSRTFFLEDVVIDPLQTVTQHGPKTVGAAWEEAGWYGFREGDHIILAPLDKVQIA